MRRHVSWTEWDWEKQGERCAFHGDRLQRGGEDTHCQAKLL